MGIKLTVWIAVLAGLVAVGQQARAQKQPPRFGLYLTHASLDYAFYPDGLPQSGSGLGGTVAYPLVAQLEAFASADITRGASELVRDYMFIHSDVGIQVGLGKGAWPIRSALGVALSHRSKVFGSVGDLDGRSGTGWSVIGALDLRITPEWSIGVKGGATVGGLDHCDPRRDELLVGCESVSLNPLSFRIGVGGIWSPSR